MDQGASRLFSRGDPRRANRRRIRLFVGIFAGSVLLAVVASSAVAMPPLPMSPTCSIAWTGLGGDGNWNTAANWSPMAVPGSGDDVCITTPGTYTVTLSGSVATVKSLTLGGSSGTQTLAVDATDFCGGATNAKLALSGGGSVSSNGTIELTHIGGCANGVPQL